MPTHSDFSPTAAYTELHARSLRGSDPKALIRQAVDARAVSLGITSHEIRFDLISNAATGIEYYLDRYMTGRTPRADTKRELQSLVTDGHRLKCQTLQLPETLKDPAFPLGAVAYYQSHGRAGNSFSDKPYRLGALEFPSFDLHQAIIADLSMTAAQTALDLLPSLPKPEKRRR
ncbi:MAG: hypothetical protein K2Q01_09545 [Rickettsiales bacterium]|nr:hypothetical protein [Rickettsiales bacterium]